MTAGTARLNEGTEIKTPLELVCFEHGGGNGLNSREHTYQRNVGGGNFEYRCSDCGAIQLVPATFRARPTDSTSPGLAF
jgi:hypothetical protein